ncbi:MAG TPA: hypothetical protein VLH19_03760 [Patescibacteria group bacterium]|nr:hypothetical protein [Patescibacteria group bacterium]
MNSTAITYDFAQALEHTNPVQSKLFVAGVVAVIFSALLPPAGALIASSVQPLQFLSASGSNLYALSSNLSISLPHDDEISLAAYFKNRARVLENSDQGLASRLDSQAQALLSTSAPITQQIASAAQNSTQETSTQATVNTKINEANIPAGISSVFIPYAQITSSTIITLIPSVKTNAILSVSNKEDGKGFTVSISVPTNTIVPFQWYKE